MTTAPIALERRQRRAQRRGAVLRRYGVPLGALLATLLLVGGIGLAVEGPAVFGHLIGRGDLPLTRTVGFVATTAAAGWLVFLLVRLLRRLLRPVHPILSIARLTLDEALRSHVVVLFTAVLLLLVCGLPLLLDAAQPLRYQIQSYLTYAYAGAALVLGAMTVLFASWNVARDMEEQRAFDVFSKPVSRGGYLVGKFLGVALLDAVLVIAVVAVMWYVPRVLYGSEASVQIRTIRDGIADPYDRLAVRSQVLIARGSAEAVPEQDFAALARTEMQQRAEEDPQGYADYIQAAGGAPAAYLQLLNQYRNEWLQIPPGEARRYVFTDLQLLYAAAEAARAEEREPPTVQLQYHVEIPALDRGTPVGLTLIIDNATTPLRALVDQKQVQEIDAGFVNEDGTLVLEIGNFVLVGPGQAYVDTGPRPQTAKLSSKDGLTILYDAGDFGPNVVRGGLVLWLRLAFLSALGTVCGAVFSFAVAAVTGLFVWVLAAGGDALAGIVASGVAETGVAAVDVAYGGLLSFSGLLATVLQTFSRLDVGGRLSSGLLISFADMRETFLFVTLGWTALTLLLGWFLFSRREIARVQV